MLSKLLAVKRGHDGIGIGIHEVVISVNGSRYAWWSGGNPLREYCSKFSVIVEIPALHGEVQFDGPIFAGEWVDDEWEALVGQQYQRELTPQEGERYLSGPRTHPFGLEAFCVLIGGRTAIFRSEEAYERWKVAQPDAEALP